MKKQVVIAVVLILLAMPLVSAFSFWDFWSWITGWAVGPPENTIAYYPFEDNANDASGNGHNANITGTMLWTDGISARAANMPLAWTGKMVIADHADFTFGNTVNDLPFSITAWVGVDIVTGSQIIATKENEWKLELWTWGVAGRLRLLLNDGEDSYDWAYAALPEEDALQDGWYFVAATYDGRGGEDASLGIKLYINGVENTNLVRYTDPSYVAINDSDQRLCLAGDCTSGDSWWGELDEIKIWDIELSADQVQSEYDSLKDNLPICIDSDGGNNSAVAGNVSYQFRSWDSTSNDGCYSLSTPSKENEHREYYCTTGGQPVYITTECPYGCANRICSPDNGSVKYSKNIRYNCNAPDTNDWCPTCDGYVAEVIPSPGQDKYAGCPSSCGNIFTFNYNDHTSWHKCKYTADSCTSGWKCKDNNTRGYQNADCSWTSTTNCTYGCADSACLPESQCTAGWQCNDTNTRAFQSANCSWSNESVCESGCVNGSCQCGGSACADEATLRFTNPDCSFADIFCPFGCLNASCLPNTGSLKYSKRIRYNCNAPDTNDWCPVCDGWSYTVIPSSGVDDDAGCPASCSNIQSFSYDDNTNWHICKYTADSCTSGWKCKDNNTRAYMSIDCSWSNESVCESGCVNNSCQCSASTQCLDGVTLRTNTSDCEVNDTFCPFGCFSGTCLDDTGELKYSKRIRYNCNAPDTNDWCPVCENWFVEVIPSSGVDNYAGCPSSCNDTQSFDYDDHTNWHICKYTLTEKYSRWIRYNCNAPDTNDWCPVCDGWSYTVIPATEDGPAGCPVSCYDMDSFAYDDNTNRHMCKYTRTGCIPSWKCKDINTIAFQLDNCSWSNESVCEFGCANGMCSCETASTCLNEFTLHTNTPDCGTADTFCQFGCFNGACLNDTGQVKYSKNIRYNCNAPDTNDWCPVCSGWSYTVIPATEDGPAGCPISCFDMQSFDYDDDTNWHVCKYLPATNVKLMSKYDKEEVFLISDEDWRNVLPLVPLTTWTADGQELQSCTKPYGGAENTCAYPTLIFHNEGSKHPLSEDTGQHPAFDADSVIYFMQQYSPTKLTLIGETPQELDNLFIVQPKLGAGLTESQIKRITPEDYLSYWQSYRDIVYVKDDYESALLASTYASLINAPLVIQGTLSDKQNVFADKRVICVGSVSPAGGSCSKSYSISELRQRYVDTTQTDKILLVNPDDWKEQISQATFETEKCASPVRHELYQKTSLASPILAAAKHEILLTTKSTAYKDINNFLKSQTTQLNINPGYLTIVSAPDKIPYNEEIEYFGWATFYRALDQTEYADTNSDKKPDIATGRIQGMTQSDVSSYIARSLFYDSINPNTNVKFMATGNPDEPWYYYVVDQAKAWTSNFKSAGYNAQYDVHTSRTYDFAPVHWENQHLMSYHDRGSANWAGIDSDKIPLLAPSVIINEASLTCSTYDSDSFCNRAIRQGAIAHVGAVGTAFTTNEIFMNTLNGIYHDNLAVGEAFTKAWAFYDKADEKYYWMITLFGDPTLHIRPQHLLAGKLVYIYPED